MGFGLDLWGYPMYSDYEEDMEQYSSNMEEEGESGSDSEDSFIFQDAQDEDQAEVVKDEAQEDKEKVVKAEDQEDNEDQEDKEEMVKEDEDSAMNIDKEENDQHAREINKSLEKLNKIHNEYEKIKKVVKQEIYNDRKKVLALLVRDMLKGDDINILEISKLHTKALGQVEYLVRLLEELDGILSYGNDDLRKQRKEINKKVQNMIEFSDYIVKKQAKLMKFIQKMKENQRNRPDKKDSIVESETEQFDEEEPTDAPSQPNESPRKFKPQHRIVDGGRKTHIQITLPRNHNDLIVKLNENGDLVIDCNFKNELVFEIDQRRVNVHNITYRIVEGVLQIDLPKMLQRGDFERQRYGRRQRINPYFNQMIF